VLKRLEGYYSRNFNSYWTDMIKLLYPIVDTLLWTDSYFVGTMYTYKYFVIKSQF